MTTGLQIAVYIVTWLSFTFGIGSCLLRIYCCISVLRTWKADDYMNIVNAACVPPAEQLRRLTRHSRQFSLGRWQSGRQLFSWDVEGV